MIDERKVTREQHEASVSLLKRLTVVTIVLPDFRSQHVNPGISGLEHWRSAIVAEAAPDIGVALSPGVEEARPVKCFGIELHVKGLVGKADESFFVKRHDDMPKRFQE